MKLEELIPALINMGIIHKIGDDYSITKNHGYAPKEEVVGNTLDLGDQAVLPVTKLYPELIRNSSESKKLKAMYDHCKVPYMIQSPTGGRYTVRSNDKFTREAWIDVMQNISLDPDIVLKVISEYYTHYEYPKAFKRFIVEDMQSAYDMYVKGETFKNNSLDNTSWV